MKKYLIPLVFFMFGFYQNAIAKETKQSSQDYYTSISMGYASAQDMLRLSYKNSASNDKNDLSLGFDNTLIFSLSVGKKINQYRVDIEFSQSKFDISSWTNTLTKEVISDDGSSLKIQTLFINTYYDFEAINQFQPFIGLGLGNSKITAKGGGSYSDSSVFTYQLKLGAFYTLNDSSDAFIQYRHSQSNDWDIGDSTLSSEYEGYKQNSIEIGLRYNF